MKTSRQNNATRQHIADSTQGRKTLSAHEGRPLPTAYCLLSADRRGLSLVEVMIAMVVLLITSLALMQTALVSISANMKNLLRDEAVSIADMRINDARSTPYANLLTDTTTIANTAACPSAFTGAPNNFGNAGVYVQRSVRNITNFGFCTHTNVNTMSDGATKQVVVTVGWLWKGTGYMHTATSIVRQ